MTREEVNRLFDLSADLMLRVVLLTLDSDEHVLLVTLHHIASDGYQDPLGSFVPRWTVAQILDDALHVTGVAAAERPARITRLLSQVRLSVELAERRPLQLSGGQRQRVAIARAIASEPKLIICDGRSRHWTSRCRPGARPAGRPVGRTGPGLPVHLPRPGSDPPRQRRCAGDAHGQVVELAPVEQLFSNPAHEYTQRLLDSVPRLPGSGNELVVPPLDPEHEAFDLFDESRLWKIAI